MTAGEAGSASTWAAAWRRGRLRRLGRWGWRRRPGEKQSGLPRRPDLVL